jgi:succinate dehydrogenase / fumarate reductase cytochrome b subunit
MAATATPTKRRDAAVRSSVGKKIAMALTGTVLLLFVIGHFVGNLKVYLGAEEFNHYAEGLRSFGSPFFAHGQLLWIIRLFLLACVAVHIWAATMLTLQSRRARSVRYRKKEALVFSYASRTMVWGGLTILAFVVFHLLHLTLGTVHPDFVAGDAYRNFVVGFQSVPVSIAYMATMVPLGFHIYHGTWSAFQTMGANNPRYNAWRRPLALTIALVVSIGNAFFPVAVLTGIVA